MMLQIFKTHHTSDTDLFYQWTRLSGFTVDFVITEPSHLTVDGHVNLHHRGIVNGPVGWALRVGIKYAPTLSELGNKPGTFGDLPQWIVGGKTGANILNETAHYAEGNFLAYHFLTEPGAYRVELLGNSHSSLAPTTDGLIEVLGDGGLLDPYNQMIVRIESA